jgi:hypothetical protein
VQHAPHGPIEDEDTLLQDVLERFLTLCGCCHKEGGTVNYFTGGLGLACYQCSSPASAGTNDEYYAEGRLHFHGIAGIALAGGDWLLHLTISSRSKVKALWRSYLAGEGTGKGQSRLNSKRVHTSVNAAHTVTDHVGQICHHSSRRHKGRKSIALDMVGDPFHPRERGVREPKLEP